MTLTLPICPRTPAECPPPGVYFNAPASDYHSWNAVSSGLVKHYAASTPKEVRYGFGEAPKPPSAAMRFGTAVHAALLEPSAYAAATEIAGLKPNAQPATFARHDKEHGPIILAEGWRDQIAAICDSVSTLDDCPDFTAGHNELAIVWDHETLGGYLIRCKALIDHLDDDGLVDVKTTRFLTPADVRRDFHKLRYGISIAGHYATAARAAPELDCGEDLPLSILAIQNEPPFDAAVYHATEEWCDYWNGEWEHNLNGLAECLALDDWPGVAGVCDDLKLEVPEYAR